MRRTKPPTIAVSNHQKGLRLDRPAIRRLAVTIWRFLKAEDLSAHADRSPIGSLSDLSLVFVTDEEIARINERFLHHRGPTDVITFQHGEIVVSTDRAAMQARRFRMPLHDELALYVIHGMLHLAGYDDHTPSSRRVMVRCQRSMLETVRKELDLRKLLR